MAIVIDDFTLPLSPTEARDILQKETNSFGIFFDVDRCFELSAILQLENRDLLKRARRLTNDPFFSLSDKAAIVEQLKKMGVNPAEFYAPKTRKAGFTADIRKSIVDNAKYSEDVHELCKICDTFNSNKRNRGNIENFAIKSPMTKALSNRKHRMSLGRPTWKILNTSRLAAVDPGIQGIPRSMGDIICEPQGYTLIRCDSSQIEPCINFSTFLRDDLVMNLILAYKDAYFGLMHYCLMTEEEELACRTNFQANFKAITITDEIQDMRQNIKRLTNAGSYGSSNLGNINPALAKAYERKLIKHPARLALENKVRQDVNRGIDTFYGFFGTPVTPDETERYSKGEDGWKEHVVRCGINNPVQTTASELMMFSIDKAREVLSRAKDSHIAFYKHDEACFYVSDEDMANGIGKELEDITAYNVKGWIPIRSEALYGVKPGDYPSYIM